MIALATRSASALAILAGGVMWTEGRLFADYTREKAVPLDPGTGAELRADALPVFVLSTDGEAEDGNILEQHWDTSRADAGIAHILANHRLTPGMEFGLGNWRNLRVFDAKDGGKKLLGDADFDMGDAAGAAAAGKVRRGYLRSTSVGWQPGGKMLRGDLPKDHPRYRAPMTDECGTRVEGYVMGTEGDPNRFIEASMTPIPCDPSATAWDGRIAPAVRDLARAARGERVSGLDFGGALLGLRDNPAVRTWARHLMRAELEAPEGRAWLRSLLAESNPSPTRTVGQLFGRN